MSCHCGNDQDYEVCCKPFHAGDAWPQTAEAMMRSRYSAFCAQELDYLLETCLPAQRATADLPSIKRWSEESDWQGLEIVSCEDGLEDDNEGFVTFVARYKDHGIAREHKERGCFRKEDGKWYFDENQAKPVVTFVRENKKVGRNDPCPCGSGKKFKKCCDA